MQNTLLKIQDAIQNAPLESILETAESVALVIPAAGQPLALVIKLLRILIQLRPAANALLDTSLQTSAFFQNVNSSNPMPDDLFNVMEGEDKINSAARAEIMVMLDQMVEIAAEDGELSPEEEGYLLDIAREAGVNENALLAKVKMKCLQNK